MSPVDFKKWPCHPVEFRGQGSPPADERVRSDGIVKKQTEKQ